MYYHYINWWRERKKERESSFKQSTANYTFILLISLISPMFLYQLVVTNDILLHFKEGFLYRHIDCLHPNYALCSLTVYIAWCVNTLCIYTYTMTNAAHMLSEKSYSTVTYATGINSHNDSVICHLNSWANSVKSHTLFSPHHISYLSTSMLSISYKRTIDFITAFMLWGRGRGTASNIGWGVGKRSFMWRYLLILMQTISPSENIKISTQKLQ